jgi:hypothetical protein
VLTHYRAGRLVAKIFIKLAWAILIVFALFLVAATLAMLFGPSNFGGIGMQIIPPTILGLLPLVFACIGSVLFGHAALAVFDMADTARKTD